MIRNYLLFILLLILVGCSAQKLAISEIKFYPEKVSKGEKVLLTVNIEDSEEMISSILAVVRRNKSYRLELNDNGEDGDKEAGDGIWSTETRVPRNAPARTYKMDFYALDTEGNKVLKIEEDGSENTLSAVASIEVVR
jgi:hypothetical protein